MEPVLGFTGAAASASRGSNGSACTSSNYTPSHVLKAMGLTDDEANEAVRFSWCHLTPEIDWLRLADRIRELMS